MKKEVLIIALFASFLIVSCKKPTSDTINPAVTTNGIKAPTGFNWENARNINFTVTITDSRYKGMANLVSIYDGDPAAGANLLAKGSATTSTTFKSKIYISNQILSVYIIKTSPDNSKVTQKVSIGTADITTSIGQ